eukprot:TRINITY_DN6402_c0_g2_i1.p1 TRINITY_DN6402_c0_g2~~TRINITY_DN6402_c0_g2_i1.p1  ORF type:complete len:214 (-),score=47.90 TRINITY_DN6402_c0_g2_i1:469-1110(-)
MTESDEEQESMSNLFTDESYVPKTFHFGDQVITVLRLEASSTDYDLTGQIVWPGAQLMGAYLSAQAECFKGKKVLELGSGVGLTGLLCARFCPVVMTDHNETVLKVMRRNVAFQTEVAKEAALHEVDCMQLEWGNRDHLDAILARHPGAFDYILGADICYQQASVPLLFRTVRQLLDVRIGAKFILAYVSRIRGCVHCFRSRVSALIAAPTSL